MGRTQIKKKGQKNPKHQQIHKPSPPQSKHLFVLNPLNSIAECYYRREVRVDFSPIRRQFGVEEITLPVFNQDRHFWTKAFVIGLRKDYYISNPLKEKEKFAEKFRRKTYHDNQSSHTSFMLNKLPLPKSSYCHLCEQNLGGNYYSHIQNQGHRKLAESNIANDYISQLVRKYQDKGQDHTPSKFQKSLQNSEKPNHPNKPNLRSQHKKEGQRSRDHHTQRERERQREREKEKQRERERERERETERVRERERETERVREREKETERVRERERETERVREKERETERVRERERETERVREREKEREKEKEKDKEKEKEKEKQKTKQKQKEKENVVM